MEPDLVGTVVQVDVTVLAFVAGTVIPLLTALVTKLEASSGVKAVVNLALSMLAAVVAYLVAHDGSGNVLDLISAAVMVYLGSGVSYQNLWKPTGVSLKVAESTAGAGLGAARKPEQAQVGRDTDQT